MMAVFLNWIVVGFLKCTTNNRLCNNQRNLWFLCFLFCQRRRLNYVTKECFHSCIAQLGGLNTTLCNRCLNLNLFNLIVNDNRFCFDPSDGRFILNQWCCNLFFGLFKFLFGIKEKYDFIFELSCDHIHLLFQRNKFQFRFSFVI